MLGFGSHLLAAQIDFADALLNLIFGAFGIFFVLFIVIFVGIFVFAFYMICKSGEERARLIATLQTNGISAVFHYLALHSSPYYKNRHDGRALPNSTRYTECLLRLPLFYALQESEIEHIIKVITAFYS